MTRSIFRLVFVWLSAVALTWAEDRFVVMPLNEITLTQGAWPVAAEPDVDWRAPEAIEVRLPYAVIDAAGEFYIVGKNDRRWQPLNEFVPEQFTLAIRVAAGAAIAGKLMLPKTDGHGMVALTFSIPATANGNETEFQALKATYYHRLLERGIPGAAWFRHQAGAAGGTTVGPRRERWQGSEYDDTFDLFSGNRALSENLQLDRELAVVEPLPEGDSLSDDPPANGAAPQAPTKPAIKVPDVALADIAGITVREFDWTARVKNLVPVLDPLAANIPADQHAVFFTSFNAMTAVMDALESAGTPVLAVFEPQSTDARTKERYQRQLCLEMSELSRRFGPQLVASVAFTGGDAYLRSGSDVAVLFEAKQPDMLMTFLAAKLQAATVAATNAAHTVEGKVGTLVYRGAVNPDRTICAYLTRIGESTVVMSNSLAQLARLEAVAVGREASLAKADEYRFFRDRYRIAGESGLLVLTDATIRRWCSPRWRIGESRRVRALATLSELQARSVAGLAHGPLGIPEQTVGLGTLTPVNGNVISQLYGTLGFLTPVGELNFERVSKAEADAYNRFHDRYQSRWSAWFDPIALQLTPQPQGIAADLTVMPLISGSEYNQLIEFTRGGKIAPQAGDPHVGTLVHVAVALDPASRPLREAGGTLVGMHGKFEVNPLSWLGGSLALYADEDPFWDELAQSSKGERFLRDNFWRAPILFQAEVKDGLKLAAFLTVLRGFAEQSAPGLTVWENRTWKDQPYLRVGPSEEAAEQNQEFGKASLFYAAMPSALMVTLNEDVLKRALNRRAERKQAKAEGKEIAVATPWLGDHLGLRVDRGIGKLVQSIEQMDSRSVSRLQLLSWANLPILNEWRRLFPREDPVAIHEHLWQVRLVCPGGGRYVWNEQFKTMESTIYGCPAVPRDGSNLPELVERLRPSGVGLSFEDLGLRARLSLSWDAAPATAPPTKVVPAP